MMTQSLSHCELITDEGIRYISNSGGTSGRLSLIELDNCPLVTDNALNYLMLCKSLRRIELYDCQLLSKEGIRRLRASSILNKII